jgi:hypothetical protein
MDQWLVSLHPIACLNSAACKTSLDANVLSDVMNKHMKASYVAAGRLLSSSHIRHATSLCVCIQDHRLNPLAEAHACTSVMSVWAMVVFPCRSTSCGNLLITEILANSLQEVKTARH